MPQVFGAACFLNLALTQKMSNALMPFERWAAATLPTLGEHSGSPQNERMINTPHCRDEGESSCLTRDTAC
jgi:hypothetical protein